jgi:hypothetical protein
MRIWRAQRRTFCQKAPEGWCNNGNPLSCSDKGFPGWQGEAGLLILLFFPGTLAHLARNFFLVVACLARCRQDFPFPFAFGT